MPFFQRIFHTGKGLTIKDKDGNDVADKNAQGDAMEVFARGPREYERTVPPPKCHTHREKGGQRCRCDGSTSMTSLPTSIQIKYTADMKKLHSWNELSTFYRKSAGTRRVLITAEREWGKAVEEFTGTTSAGKTSAAHHHQSNLARCPRRKRLETD